MHHTEQTAFFDCNFRWRDQTGADNAGTGFNTKCGLPPSCRSSICDILVDLADDI